MWVSPSSNLSRAGLPRLKNESTKISSVDDLIASLTEGRLSPTGLAEIRRPLVIPGGAAVEISMLLQLAGANSLASTGGSSASYQLVTLALFPAICGGTCKRLTNSL